VPVTREFVVYRGRVLHACGAARPTVQTTRPSSGDIVDWRIASTSSRYFEPDGRIHELPPPRADVPGKILRRVEVSESQPLDGRPSPL